MLVAVGDMARADSGFRGSHHGADVGVVASKLAGCRGCVGGYSRARLWKAGEMQKIWLGLVILAVEAVVLVWLVGGHVLQWFSSGLAGR